MTNIGRPSRKTCQCTERSRLLRHCGGLASRPMLSRFNHENRNVTDSFFYRSIIVKTMALQEVDIVELQSLKTSLDRVKDVLNKRSVYNRSNKQICAPFDSNHVG